MPAVFMQIRALFLARWNIRGMMPCSRHAGLLPRRFTAAQIYGRHRRRKGTIFCGRALFVGNY